NGAGYPCILRILRTPVAQKSLIRFTISEAEEISLNPKLTPYLIRVKDEDGELIILFEGKVYRKEPPLEELIRTDSA
ncbi:MAG TPA: hypothetical protein VMX75_02860, partial [Spirochaetia bacterium]|nr:hypothetical protein [Spirochaetia bacterium]